MRTYRVLLLLIALIAAPVYAANPTSGSLDANGTALTWTGTATGGFYASHDPLGGDDNCTEGDDCDTFILTVTGSAAAWAGKSINVKIEWLVPSNDYDLYIRKDSSTGPVIDSSGNPNGLPEEATITPSVNGTGVYAVHVVYFNVAPGVDQYKATATIASQTEQPPPPPPGTGIPPRYQTYTPSGNLGQGAGEPSIGSDWKTGKVLFEAGLETLRASFDDCSSPARTTWEDVTPLTSTITSLDPILWTHSKDPRPQVRTWASQLTGEGSLSSHTDDDGDNWTPNQGGPVDSGVDHQTIGGGPFAPGIQGALFPYGVYYCSQSSATAFCALSLDGGQTFGPGVPIYDLTQCGGIHGHVKVGPDGSVYVPNRSCGANQGVAVSTDNGITWSVVLNPYSISTSRLVDPSVGIGANGTVYFGYQNTDGTIRAAVLKRLADGTYQWSNDQDVGAQLGIKNITFPAMVAGDDDRAALAFLGTTTPGDYTDPSTYPQDAVWHLYVSHTYDGGQHWLTVDVTPNDPVQRHTICNLGTVDCDHIPDDRNLLDFMDITVDEVGRAVVGYADGCLGGCVFSPPNSYSALASIARQSGGRRLFHQFDPVEPVVPAAPGNLAALNDGSGFIRLLWSAPDNGGSPITKYNVFRRTSNGSYSLLGVSAKTTFNDVTADPNTQYWYKVTAVNSLGESQSCGEATAVSGSAPSPCSLPGVLVSTDNSDGVPNVPPDPSVNIQKLYVGEPYLGNVPDKLVITLKVQEGATSVPPSSQWYIIWNKLAPDADFDRNYVAMKSDSAGNISFEYGKLGVPLNPLNPNPNANVPVRLGDADSGGYDRAAGNITITISNSKVEGIHAYQNLNALNARTFYNRPDLGQPINQTTASDFGPDGSYMLAGNASCKPNSAPVAVLKVTPQSGFAPLTVTLDGSQSTDPDGEQIAQYTFNFGDGSAPVTQAGAVVNHTYANSGFYAAILTVKDPRAMQSGNIASKVIEAKPSANLALTLTDAPDPVKVRQNLTYTIRVRNDGPSKAFGLTMTDVLPSNVTFKSATPTQGSCRLSQGKVICNLGDFTTGQQHTVTVVVTPTKKGTLSNTASVVAASPTDPNNSNNSATVSTTVNP